MVVVVADVAIQIASYQRVKRGDGVVSHLKIRCKIHILPVLWINL